VNRRSEFAGLSADEQYRKLDKAMEIFRAQGIRPDTWIAPAHSFDEITIQALKRIGLKIISDGFFFWPGMDHNNVIWLPQQLWRFQYCPFGVWTVCLHMNSWTSTELKKFHRDILKYRKQITSASEVLASYPDRVLRDHDYFVAKLLLGSLLLKRYIERLWAN
jgi:hypothetical protein